MITELNAEAKEVLLFAVKKKFESNLLRWRARGLERANLPKTRIDSFDWYTVRLVL
jgi:hypothetical protein